MADLNKMPEISLALPKGRFEPNSQRVLRSLVPHTVAEPRRCAWDVQWKGFTVHIKLLKVQDIAALLASNELDFGVANDEWIRENHASAVELMDLGWCTSRIVLAGASKHFADLPAEPLKVATSFPQLAEECLRTIMDNFVIRHVHGSVEAFVPGMCDGVFDCVETGETLRANGLTIIKSFIDSSVRLYAAPQTDMPEFEHHIRTLFAPHVLRNGPRHLATRTRL